MHAAGTHVNFAMIIICIYFFSFHDNIHLHQLIFKFCADKKWKKLNMVKLMNRYEEKNLKVGRKKTNLMFIGDGTGKTTITGKRNVMDGLTTFHTASFGKFSFSHIFRFNLVFWFMMFFYPFHNI